MLNRGRFLQAGSGSLLTAPLVAMLHSADYGETEKTRQVLAHDPRVASPAWGIAAILMDNPLTGVGSSKEWAERGQTAVAEGRKVRAKTQRERDYIEAVAAYWEDWPNRPERARQLARGRAYEKVAAKYPTDEAQIFAPEGMLCLGTIMSTSVVPDGGGRQ